MKYTKIEWAHHTVNYWWGCTKVSPACFFCYAEAMAKIWRQKDVQWGPGGARWLRHGKAGKELFRLAVAAKTAGQRHRVFINSMSDTFEDHPSLTEARELLFVDLEEVGHSLDCLLLTKRPENVLRMVPRGWLTQWPSHVWIGTTVEDQQRADQRIPELLKIPARVRFLSCEPLLGPVDLDQWIKPWLYCGHCGDSYEVSDAIPDPDGHPHGADKCARCGEEGFMTSWNGDDGKRRAEAAEHRENDDYGLGIHWVICGGESGPGARPMHPNWARSLRDQCKAAGVPFLFKQWGEHVPWEFDESEFNNVCGSQHGKELWHDAAPRDPCNLPSGWDAFWFEEGDLTLVQRVGKSAAGRLLDGIEHNDFPEVQS
jgi:protein gp37